MSDTDWWARKLSGQTRPSTVQVPAPAQQGFGAPRLPPTTAPGTVRIQEEQGPAPDFIEDDAGNKVPNIYKPWSGNIKDGWAGDAHKDLCPNCGSNEYFSRSSTQYAKTGITTRNGMATPAPHCWACGFTGGSVGILPFGGGATDDTERNQRQQGRR